MKKFLPTLIAIFLIIIVVLGLVGGKAYEKYSYSKERKDMNQYYNLGSLDEVAIVLQDEVIETKAKLMEGRVYLDFNSVQDLLNDRFYLDKNENWLIYTTPTDVIKNQLGTGTYFISGGENNTEYLITAVRDDTVYVALDYVKMYTNFTYEYFPNPNRIQLRTQWGEKTTATIKKDTAVRYRGGVKSEILREISEGEEVTVLDELDTWVKVKTSDAMMGYVETKFLSAQSTVEELPPTDYVEPVYTNLVRDHKINMGWHAIYAPGGNDTLDSVTNNVGNSFNVISPTWYSLTDNEGNYSSFASTEYINKAHNKGMEVWPLLDNFNANVSTLEIMSYTSKRSALVDRLIADLLAVGADGINLDFEQIPYEAGEHYVEFIREMSIKCRENNLVLSVDNYVPKGNTEHYNRREQGVVADYVIIMGYDEHWGSGGVAGSVASIGYVLEGIETTLKQVPADKVINAVPFYTRVWKTVGGNVTSEALGMDAASNFINQNAVDTYWDAETCQNYGEKQIGDTFYQVWLEDSQSIEAKLNVMDAHGIAGVAEWQLGFENSGIWSTIDSYMYR